MDFSSLTHYIISQPKIIILVILNITFMMALWHMDVNHEMDIDGKKRTRGFFHVSPERAYRASQYTLIISLFLVDLIALAL